MSLINIMHRHATRRGAAILLTALSILTSAQRADAQFSFRPTTTLELPGSLTQYFPESVTAGPGGELFTSSVQLGVIYKFPAQSTTPEFFTAAESGSGISGVLYDHGRDVLWACIDNLGNFTSRLQAFNPTTGAVIANASYAFPDGGLCADIAIASASTIYVTDTNINQGHQSQIFKLVTPTGNATGGTLSPWANNPAFSQLEANGGPFQLGLNGIVYDPLLQAVYAGKYNSGQLFRVPVQTNGSAGTATEIALGQPLPTIDGMRLLVPGIILAAVDTGPVVAITVVGNQGFTNAIGEFDQPSSLTISADGIWVSEGQELRAQGIDPSPVDLPFELRRLLSE